MEDGQHGVHVLKFVTEELKQEHAQTHPHHAEDQTVRVPHLRHVTLFDVVSTIIHMI